MVQAEVNEARVPKLQGFQSLNGVGTMGSYGQVKSPRNWEGVISGIAQGVNVWVQRQRGFL